MAAFQYRLATLLEQRETHKQSCEKALAERRSERRREQQVLSALTGRQEALAEEVRSARSAPLPADATGDSWQHRASDIALFQQRVEEAKDAVFSQQLRLEEFEQRFTEATEALRLASQEVETLLKHRAQAESQFSAALERKETQEQEEIAAVLYEKRRQA